VLRVVCIHLVEKIVAAPFYFRDDCIAPIDVVSGPPHGRRRRCASADDLFTIGRVLRPIFRTGRAVLRHASALTEWPSHTAVHERALYDPRLRVAPDTRRNCRQNGMSDELSADRKQAPGLLTGGVHGFAFRISGVPSISFWGYKFN